MSLLPPIFRRAHLHAVTTVHKIHNSYIIINIFTQLPFLTQAFYVAPGLTGRYVYGLSVHPAICPSVCPSVCHTLGVPLCVQRPANTMPFQQIIMYALLCQHDVDVHLLFCFDLDLHITCFQCHGKL